VYASSCRQAGPAVTEASMLIAKLAVVDPAHLQSSSEKQSVLWGRCSVASGEFCASCGAPSHSAPR